MTKPAFWRPMTARDLDAVKMLADSIHVLHPEDMEVFTERLRLYPAGCQVLGNEDGLIGYALSHPWRLETPPPLNSALGRIPDEPETFYIHDVALLPDARGKGHAGDLVELLARHARGAGFGSLSLVAVNRSSAFWERFGFAPAMTNALRAKLASYGDDALMMRRDLRTHTD